MLTKGSKNWESKAGSLSKPDTDVIVLCIYFYTFTISGFPNEPAM
jgi:hypothetical protein